jgi:hypothetical protein
MVWSLPNPLLAVKPFSSGGTTMSATMEEARLGTPAMAAKESPRSPQVVYHYDSGLIEATVIVSLVLPPSPPPLSDPELLGLKVYAPVIAVPAKDASVQWTIVWELVGDKGVKDVQFCGSGIDHDPADLPHRVRHFKAKCVESCPDKWQAEIRHDVEELNYFPYMITFEVIPERGNPFNYQYKHDPTIVVCQDPVGKNTCG